MMVIKSHQKKPQQRVRIKLSEKKIILGSHQGLERVAQLMPEFQTRRISIDKVSLAEMLLICGIRDMVLFQELVPL